jgi:hypothetical protein
VKSFVRSRQGAGFDHAVGTQGATLLRSARLYRGQTTNVRTAGGGLDPVLTLAAR